MWPGNAEESCVLPELRDTAERKDGRGPHAGPRWQGKPLCSRARALERIVLPEGDGGYVRRRGAFGRHPVCGCVVRWSNRVDSRGNWDGDSIRLSRFATHLPAVEQALSPHESTPAARYGY